MVGLTSADSDMDFYNDAEEILSIAFSEWEVILCTSKSLDLVWAQVLSDPFLRRLILRFIFCRSVLSAFCPLEDEQYLPCLPAPSSQFCLRKMRSCAVSCNSACKSPEGGRLFSV
ncbi:PROTEIN SCAI [Salix koriyanagi]|uniref:PROTEIN SCAI n=1 Tax=Salix koriyanagi TaxID=2511006 RepID=A0A9Q0UPM6_9ROSI|nr:PROTEIN SCAI [Salix koriyanagi]